MPYSIMLDAGHGGRDPGAVFNGRQEKDDTLALTLTIGEILEDNGIDVQYTRTTDIYKSPFERAQEANNAGVDFFISIHRNSYPVDNTVSGVESLVYDLSGLKLQMAENINSQLETIGFVNLGVKARPNLAVLRRTRMPAVLVEVGFLNSDTDNFLFDQNFNDIAQAIAAGILDTLEENNLIPDPRDDEMPSMQPPTSPAPPQSSGPAYEYRVQVGAYRNPVYANRHLDELREQDFPAYITEENRYFLVQIGNYQMLDEAVEMERRLRRAGYQTIILRYPRSQ